VLFFASLAQEGQMSICLPRREFIMLLGAARPLVARAQQSDRMRRTCSFKSRQLRASV
jgi:hypothetical protein